MKTIMTIVMLLAAMLAIKTSAANSQEACSKGYVSCVDACVGKKGIQDKCIEVCQQRNDQCSAGVYGTPAPQPVNTQRPKESGEAMDARDDGNAAPDEKPATKARTKASASTTAKAPQSRKQDVR